MAGAETLPAAWADWRARLARLAAGALLMLAAVGFVEARYRLGWVVQEPRCLVDTHLVLYERAGGPPERGGLYAITAPDQAVALGLFEPAQVFLKRVAGLPGDRVEITAGTTRVNGIALAAGLDLAGPLGRAPQDFTRAFTVPPHHLFLLGETRDSYDGRYFGVVALETHGLGRGWRLW